MKIKSISVEVRETVSLPGYCNSTRGVTLTADVYDGDIYDADLHSLTCIAEEKVHGEVDDILEAAGEPPKFYTGRRYRSIECPVLGMTAVLPDDFRSPNGWYTLKRGFRLEAALADAEKRSLRCLGLVEDVTQLPRPIEEPRNTSRATLRAGP